jgi:acylphosphatase
MVLRRAHLRIHGTVQGVSFRAYARDQARKLQLKGWVRNLPDGDVEALAEGGPDAVDAFVRWCHQGSPEAAVESVKLVDPPASGELATFEILH